MGNLYETRVRSLEYTVMLMPRLKSTLPPLHSRTSLVFVSNKTGKEFHVLLLASLQVCGGMTVSMPWGPAIALYQDTCPMKV